MIYLDSFRFPTLEREDEFLSNYYSYNSYGPQSHYPFEVLSLKGLTSLDFSEITVLYGGNGSGKSTALNVIANKLKLSRASAYNKGDLQNEYLKMCSYVKGELDDLEELRDRATFMSSDDIFRYMLDNRKKNESIRKRTDSTLFDYFQLKKTTSIPRHFNFETGEGLDKLEEIKHARKMSPSEYLKEKIGERTVLFSNGETGFIKFIESIVPDRLYILDEPENSLSCELQMKLAQYIEESSRYLGCQFIIATHSPFLLALENAKIYNLDGNPATVSCFGDLPNMKLFYNLFKEHEEEFK